MHTLLKWPNSIILQELAIPWSLSCPFWPLPVYYLVLQTQHLSGLLWPFSCAICLFIPTRVHFRGYDSTDHFQSSCFCFLSCTTLFSSPNWSWTPSRLITGGFRTSRFPEVLSSLQWLWSPIFLIGSFVWKCKLCKYPFLMFKYFRWENSLLGHIKNKLCVVCANRNVLVIQWEQNRVMDSILSEEKVILWLVQKREIFSIL